jgi:hypothetical protein
MQLLPDYFAHTLDTKLISKKMAYCAYMPIQMGKYNDLKEAFRYNKMPIDWNTGMIEQAKSFGFGKIGLAHETGDWEIHDDFIAYKIVGEYSQMRTAYRKIKQDYPTSENFYNVYLTDPNVTKVEENITYIVFQIQQP